MSEKKSRTEAQKRADKKYDEKRKGRTRNFATVVYPSKEQLEKLGSDYDGSSGYGSAPDDWQERLIEMHIPCLISPLHDKDEDPDGARKKPHWHVLLMFETVKDFETQVKPIFDEIGGVGREQVNSARGYARYLCHLDNSDKAQYNIEDVKAYGGADYLAITHLPTDDILALRGVFDFIRVNQIQSLAELIDICSDYYPDWFSMISMSRGYIVDKYIKSVTWEQENGYTRKTSFVDTLTGESVSLELSEESEVTDNADN